MSVDANDGALPLGEAAPGTVAGERGPTAVRRIGAGMRFNQALSVAVMILVGVTVLSLYYWHWIGTVQERNSARFRDTKAKANTEMRLPRLGAEPMRPAMALANPKQSLSPIDPYSSAPEIPLTPAEANVGMAPALAMAANPKADPILEAPVMMRETHEGRAGLAPPASVGFGAEADGSGTELTKMMQASTLEGVTAHRLPTQRLLLPKGASLDCTLQTAIDSTLPGLTTCVTAVDVFGADGRVVLLERGTILVGETKSEIKQGQARVFVIWSEARTPTGVIIPLASPGTDQLGRTGLSGGYDTHFGERFGAAILVSIIDGAVQAAANAERGRGSGANVVVDPQGSRDVLTEVMHKTISIPPTITVNQGARVAVIVARNVDFRSVYALREAN